MFLNFPFFIFVHRLNCFSRAIATPRRLNFLKIDKPVNFVPAGEAPFKGSGFMLINALSDVASNAGIKRLGPVCHYVNVVPFFQVHRSFDYALTFARAPLRMTAWVLGSAYQFQSRRSWR